MVKILSTKHQMHVLIITPLPLQGGLLESSLKRQNFKTLTCLPKSLTYEWFPETDAVVVPHTLSQIQWEKIKEYLINLSSTVPLISMSQIPKEIYENVEFQVILPRIVKIDESMRMDDIPIIIKDCIRKSSKLKNDDSLEIGKIKLDRRKRLVEVKNRQIVLTKKEFYLLELLMINAGQVITRESIIEHVWDRRSFVAQNTIDVYISRLRRKIDKYVNRTFIKTVPCLGYQFEKMETLQRSRM